MPWIIGIDEAGYGPPLGPLVMTSVACRIPGSAGKTDLWRLLEAVVRGHSCEPDERILIADSKLVYSTARGLHDLEFGVTAALPYPRRSTLARLSTGPAPKWRANCILHSLKGERFLWLSI